MKLSEAANLCGMELAPAISGMEIAGLSYDSRTVTPGSLFFCLRGGNYDGHAFAARAVQAGATAVCAQLDVQLPDGVPVLSVADTRLALALVSAAFFGYPSRKLRVTGITGTNGKTTTVYLLDQILTAAGRRSGFLGTAGNRLGAGMTPGTHTTPESLELQRSLAQAVDNGVQDLCMEVSSHALDQGRVRECFFNTVVFTNCTQDHLDYHKSMAAYAAAKARLFNEYAMASQRVKGSVRGVINVDDAWGRRIAATAPIDILSYAIAGKADVRALDLRCDRQGSSFRLCTPDWEGPVQLPLIGDFNVYNALAAIAAALTLGIEASVAAGALEQAASAPGRLEPVQAGQPFAVLVDYAHTPDGLEKVLSSVRPGPGGRLIVVFGCGGDRDRGKRPLMGEIAARLADMAVLTSDNPRSERPEAIVEDVLAGMANAGGVVVEPDRRRAIEIAVEAAEAEDVVIIAGKGHEDYQIIGGSRLHFDDREEAAAAISRLKGRNGHAH